MATVRIFLPTYRRPELLPRALASLQAQTCTDWICELHNDDPTDPTPGALVKQLGDARITVVTHERNLGATATFNLFFGATISEPFYSLLEDDNWWEPDFLATMLAAADAHPGATILWANMRVAEEQLDGSFLDTGRTLWPQAGDSVRWLDWGQSAQICGALHSNGAMLVRCRPGQDFRIPAVPLAVIEPFRERMFPHPLLLVTRPLATFSLTRQTSRSDDPQEWAESQAILAATFFHGYATTPEETARIWRGARAQRPTGTSNLILAALADPRCRHQLAHATWRDWWVVLRGFIRRPGLYARVRRSHRTHADWWQFLEDHTARRWREKPVPPG